VRILELKGLVWAAALSPRARSRRDVSEFNWRKRDLGFDHLLNALPSGRQHRWMKRTMAAEKLSEIWALPEYLA
jgi:hypothetical protein